MKNKRSRQFQDSSPATNNFIDHGQALPTTRLNMDELAILQDEELLQNLDSLHENRGRALKSRNNTVRAWEDEICYVKRELQLRKDRRYSHDEYLKTIEADFKNIQKEERSLPSADLDNSEFLVI